MNINNYIYVCTHYHIRKLYSLRAAYFSPTQEVQPRSKRHQA